MFVATHATRSTKLLRSGMKSVRSRMPLLRSLARRRGTHTIDMALLAELGLPAVRKDACKVQAPPSSVGTLVQPSLWSRPRARRTQTRSRLR